MKRFILYLIKIFLVVFLLALIIQKLADFGLMKSNYGLYNHWSSILAGDINSDLLILGSSRGVVSYDPLIFQKNTGLTSFNLSFDAAPYNLQKIKLEIYLEKNAEPKILIQNVDITYFNKSSVIPNQHQFIPFIGVNNFQERFKLVDPFFGKHYFIPLLKYNGSVNYLKTGLSNIFNSNPTTLANNQAYSPKTLNFQKDIHNLERLHNLDKNEKGFDLYEPDLDAFEKFLIELPAETKVFLIWAPEHYERLKYAKEIREKIEMKLEEINNKYSHVYFLNYSRDSISLQQNLFYDTFHLNKEGATIFSEKVSMDIVEILR